MRIDVDAKIPFPRDIVFATYRDKLTDLVQYLPNVKSIAVLERTDEGPISKLRNEWWAKGEVPKIAQSFLKPEMLSWYDHATWNQSTFSNEWRIQMRIMEKVVDCKGGNSFEHDGTGTVLRIRGELNLDLKQVPGVPRFLAGTAGPAVEKFVVGMLKPNLVEVSKGIEQYLRARA
jgi:hypothetical protein